MDMTVQAKQWLMRFDCSAHRPATCPMEHDLAAPDDLGWRIRAPVQHRTGVQCGIHRRYVKVEDRAVRVRDAPCQSLDHLSEVIVVELARCLPRRSITEPNADHRMMIV